MINEPAERLQHDTFVAVGGQLPGDFMFLTTAFDPAEFANHAYVVMRVLFESDTACGGHFGDEAVEVRV